MPAVSTSVRSLVFHLAGLWILLLVAAVWVVDVDRAVFDPDEGALLMQVEVLGDEGSWFTPYWLNDLDPDGDGLAIQYAQFRDGEVAPSPVRPALVVITAAAWKLGGVTASTLLGLTGVVMAIGVAAAIARQLDPRAMLPTIWLLGATSPLAMHASVLRGHGPATGLAALAVWGVIVETGRGQRPRVLVVAGISLATFLAAGLRREVVLLAVALATVMLYRAVRDRSASPAVLGTAPALAAVAAFLADRLAVQQIFGHQRSLPATGSDDGYLVGRLDSLSSLVQPGFEDGDTLALALMLTAAVVTIAAAVRFLLVGDARELLVGTSLAATLLAIRLVAAPPDMVSGIIPAFPIGVAAVILAAPSIGRIPLLKMLSGWFATFVALVVLTQYSIGGAWEWGSRFLAVGLVLVLPVAAVGLLRTWDLLPAGRLRAGLTAATLALAVLPLAMGLLAHRDARINNAANVATAHELAVATGSNLVVSTNPAVPRTDTTQIEGPIRWLWAWPDELAPLLSRLEDAGFDEVAFASREPTIAVEYLDPLGWEIGELRAQRANPGTQYLGVLRRAG